MYVQASHIPMKFVLDTTVRDTKNGMLSPSRVSSCSPTASTSGPSPPSTWPLGRIRWQKRLPGQLMFGGAVATAGDLVFFGQSQGLLDAVDAETGELLGHFQVGKGGLGPPITFQVDGHQRIAVASPQGLTVFGLAEGQ